MGLPAALGEDFPLWTSQATVESLVGEGEGVGGGSSGGQGHSRVLWSFLSAEPETGWSA